MRAHIFMMMIFGIFNLDNIRCYHCKLPHTLLDTFAKMSQEEFPIEFKESKDAMEIQQDPSEQPQAGLVSPSMPIQGFGKESSTINHPPSMIFTYPPPQDYRFLPVIQKAQQRQENRNSPINLNQMEVQEQPITQQQANHFKNLRNAIKGPQGAHSLGEKEDLTSQFLTTILKRLKCRMLFLSNKPIIVASNELRIDRIIRFHIEDNLIYLLLKFQGQQSEEMVDIYKMRKQYGFQLGQYVHYCFCFLESFEKMEEVQNLDEVQANYLLQMFGLLSEQDKHYEDMPPFQLKNIYEEKQRQRKQEDLKQQMMKEKLEKREQEMKQNQKRRAAGKKQEMISQEYDEGYHSPFDWTPS